jgi:hypothetical protein
MSDDELVAALQAGLVDPVNARFHRLEQQQTKQAAALELMAKEQRRILLVATGTLLCAAVGVFCGMVALLR